MGESVATVISIQATSRASVKVGDSFYTVEYCECRNVPENLSQSDLQHERKVLWDTVNAECDGQIEEILRTFKK